MVLDENIPTVLGDFHGGGIYRFVVTNTGPIPLASVLIEGQNTPEGPWLVIVDSKGDVTNLTGLLGYTTSDGSDDLMTLKPGVAGSVYIDCSTYTRIRVSATGKPTAEATASADLPSGFPIDLSGIITSPAGAGVVGVVPGHGLVADNVQDTLYELADDTTFLAGVVGDHESRITLLEDNPYVLPVATGVLLGGVKGGGNIAIAGDGTLSYTPYTLPVATAGVLGGVKIGANISVTGDGTISVSAGGTGTVTSVNGESPVAGAVTINTSHITENTNLYFTESRVLATIMAGISFATGTAVTAADSLLIAAGKLQKQITDIIASVALKLSLSGGTMTGNITGGDNKVIQMLMQDTAVVAVDKGNSGTSLVTFDYTAGSKQKSTATGNHTFAFSNWPPTGNEGVLRVDFVNYGAFTITPPTVTWTNPDGTETTSLVTHFAALAAVGGRSGFTSAGITKAIFWCSDAGTTVYGKFI